MADIVDLRGREQVPARVPVLSDPSGRRARLLARAGRVMAAVLMVWLAGLALAGLGILPAGDVPLGPAIASQAPPALHVIPAPIDPSASDLTPAVAVVPASAPATLVGQAQTTRVGAASGSSVHRTPVTGHGSHHSAGSGHSSGSGTTGGGGSTGTGTVPITSAPNPPAAGAATGAPASHAVGTTTAPGQSTSQSTPGHTRTTAPGNSATAPGQVKQTTTTATTSSTAPGQSGTAPGQAVTHGSGGHVHNG